MVFEGVFVLVSFCGGHGFPSPVRPGIEEVIDLKIVDTPVVPNPSRRRLDQGAHGKRLTFSAGDRAFDFLLHPVEAYATSARVITHSNGQRKVGRSPRSLAFKSDVVTGKGWARVVIDGSGGLRGLIHDSKELLAIHPRPPPELLSNETTLRDGSLALWRVKDVPDEGARCNRHDADPRARGHMGRHVDDPRGHGHSSTDHASHRRLGELPSGPPYGRMEGCPDASVLYDINVGVVVDQGYAARIGGSSPTESEVEAEIQGIFASANAIFEDQVPRPSTRPAWHKC